MPGEKVCIAAATVVALAADLAGTGDQLAVVAFWSDATVVAPLAAPVVTATLLDRLLRIPAKGLTNVGFDLQVAHAELARSGAAHRTAVMLTDAVHNAGPDPRTIARRFPALHVLLETDGEHDGSLARDLARLGHGRIAPVRTHRDVAPVLNRVLARDGAEAWRPDRQTDNLSETRVSMADGAIKDSWPGLGRGAVHEVGFGGQRRAADRHAGVEVPEVSAAPGSGSSSPGPGPSNSVPRSPGSTPCPSPQAEPESARH